MGQRAPGSVPTTGFCDDGTQRHGRLHRGRTPSVRVPSVRAGRTHPAPGRGRAREEAGPQPGWEERRAAWGARPRGEVGRGAQPRTGAHPRAGRRERTCTASGTQAAPGAAGRAPGLRRCGAGGGTGRHPRLSSFTRRGVGALPRLPPGGDSLTTPPLAPAEDTCQHVPALVVSSHVIAPPRGLGHAPRPPGPIIPRPNLPR